MEQKYDISPCDIETWGSVKCQKSSKNISKAIFIYILQCMYVTPGLRLTQSQLRNITEKKI